MIIKNARVFTLEEGFVKKDVCIQNGYFTDNLSDDGITIDGEDNYLIPGLVDVHFHGCAGVDFSDGTPEVLAKIGEYEASHGITSICPASMTLSEETLLSVCSCAASYEEANSGKPFSRLCGIHLEGPFISLAKKGAQNPEFITSPQIALFQRLQDASNGMVKLITIAPEVEGSKEFIDQMASKVHISLGHTTSDYDTAYQAFLAGADHVTHLYNAMPAFTHRSPGPIGAAFDSAHVMPELICDGIHIAPAAVRMTVKLFGEERMIFVSDSMRATGMPDGDYSLGGLPVKVKGSYATLADGTLAGSATNLFDCMRMGVSMGLPITSAVRFASYNPAKSIGVDNVCGSIEAGKYGDCLLISKEDLSLQKVILRGDVI